MGKNNTYTPEMLDFLQEHSDISRAELTNLFNAKFNTNKTKDAIRHFTRKKGWVDNNIRYTPEMLDFLREHNDLPILELTKAFNVKFKTEKLMRHITKVCQREGIVCNTIRYSQQELDFIHKHSALPRQQLANLFNAKFNTNKTADQMKAMCQRYNWSAASNGQFKPGDKNHWQTGLSKEEFKSHYSPESMQNMISAMMEYRKKLKLGDNTVKSGVLYEVINVDYSIPFAQRIVPKRRIVWEREKGPIPDGHVIIQADADFMNCDINNLRCIPRAYISIINKNKWAKTSPELLDAAIKYCELLLAIK